VIVYIKGFGQIVNTSLISEFGAVGYRQDILNMAKTQKVFSALLSFQGFVLNFFSTINNIHET